ncbi:hypothetical protein JD524_14165 [Aeromonas caviae]|uniref:hypothetical protein n=1 Tax=Aeromonas caviae TaxID=648 RepID=UPI00192018EC|nr:hypothetical protein [Aeromonas caviae]MBL0655758.1 hypothetical protein [Aeromonas caviae]
MTEKSKSPYLKAQRLEDVIAAIQVMGKYAYYKLTPEKWADRIAGDATQSTHWQMVFTEHPEFFRFDSARQKVSLAWRRNYRKRYSVDEQREISFEQFSTLDDESKLRISRLPLTGDEVSILVNTAINLHARAIEHNKEYRWMSSPLFSLLSVALGGLLVWLGK